MWKTWNRSPLTLTTCALAFALSGPVAGALGAPLPAERAGWVITPTPHSFEALVGKVETAITGSGLNKVTAASASAGAKNIGVTIPGNMVIGVFAPKYAVRMLDASVAAGIEAPLRLYLTENDGGTSTLSYVTATYVFAPYDDGGEALKALAAELDAILAKIAAAASAP